MPPATPANAVVHITAFKGGVDEPTTKVAQGRRVETTIEQTLTGLCTTPSKRPEDKEHAAGWSPGTFKDDYRNGKNVEEMWAVGFDVDVEPVPDLSSIADTCAHWRGCIHSTWSHHHVTNKNPNGTARYRLVLITNRAMTREEQPRVWDAIRARLPFGVGIAGRDAARLWFAPSLAADGSYEARELKGEPIDVDAVLSAIDQCDEIPKVSTTETSQTLDFARSADPQRRDLATQLLAANWPPVGTRHHARLALAGALKRDGWDVREATEMVLAVCQSPESERAKHAQDVRATFERGSADINVTGWTTLEKYIEPSIVSAARDMLKPYEAPWQLGAPKVDADADGWLSNIKSSAQPQDPSNPLSIEYGGLDQADEPTKYLVQDILPEESLGMFVAQPYGMKTWAAYSLGIAVAHGKPWLGKHPTRKGRVLILDYEMGQRKMKKRLRMLGDDGSVGRIASPPWRLDKTDLWAALYEAKPDLVIVDTLSAGNRSQDENQPEFAIPLDHAKAMIEALAKEEGREFGCSFIFLHHPVKDTNGKAKQSTVRGTGAIFGALDVCYALEAIQPGDNGEKRSTIECIKMREGEEPPKFTLQLTDARGIELYEEAQSSAEGGGGATLEDAIILYIGKQGPSSAVELRAGLKPSRSQRTVNEAVALLRSRGRLYHDGRRLHVDGPNLRVERILKLALDPSLNPSSISSPAKLAKLAHVTVEDVEELLARGKLARSSEGSNCAWFIPEGGG